MNAIVANHAFPMDVLSGHVAVLGMTGSGKTSTEKLIVEQVVNEGFRVCVLDTLKSDWWGVTSSADGKRPGLPFKILGGPRGHVPLHSGAGKAIGKLVGEGKLPLSIIDMADFEAGGIQKFFADFAHSLWRHVRGVVYLVIEEAHEIAPKERVGFGAENMAIHWAKKLGTGSRSKGIRLIVATQRVQALHNAVLGSCQTLVAHQLMFDADQVPVLKWLKAVKKDAVKEVEASLASLPAGTGWLCSGKEQIFEQRAFPKFQTYDHHATPTNDAKAIDVKTAAVDPDELRAIIGDAVKDAEENDPKLLRAKVAELQRKLAAPTKPATNTPQNIPAPSQKAIEQAETRGFGIGFDQGREDGFSTGYRAGYVESAKETNAGYINRLAALIDDGKAWSRVDQSAIVVPPLPARKGSKKPAMPSVAALATEMDRAAADQIAHNKLTDVAITSTASILARRPEPAQSNPAVGSLTNPQLALLETLAWWKGMGHEAPTRVQLAAKAGWKPSGSNLRNRLSELSSMGLVTYPAKATVQLTDDGEASAPVPNLASGLIESIQATLTNPQRAIFDFLLTTGGPCDRAHIGAALGWDPGGSNLRNRLSELSALELISYPSKGEVALQDWVQ